MCISDGLAITSRHSNSRVQRLLKLTIGTFS